MADNYLATQGSGTTFSAKDVGAGVLTPRMKISVVNASAVESDLVLAAHNGIPIEGVASGVPVPVSGTFFQATQPGSLASGTVASGAIASGAVASGAFASGALAAGSISNGADVAEGLTTDAASATSTIEDATARTGIGLWKGIKNLLKLINDKMVSGTDIGDVTINNATAGAAVNIQAGGNSITVDGTLAVTGTFYQATQPVAAASGAYASGSFASGSIANGANVAQGSTTDVPATVVEDATARTGISLWKSIKNYLKILVDGFVATNTARTTATLVLPVQPIDAAGNVLGATAANVARTTATLVNPVQVIDATGAVLSADRVTKGTGFSNTVTLTVTNGAYSVSDVTGGLITLSNVVSANGKRSIIKSITLAGVAAIPYELWFFTSDLVTPIADNGVFTLVVADTLKVVGVVPILAGNYYAPASAFNVASLKAVELEIQPTTTTIYAYLKTTAVTSPGTTTLYLTVTGQMVD